jgi:hypothetical protein
VTAYRFGPCAPWTPTWTCDIAAIAGAAAVTGVAVEIASEVLYLLTAQRFDQCSVTIRPCRQECVNSFGAIGTWWQYGTYPRPYWWNGTWYNLTCGSGCPSNSCSCVTIDEVTLPGPVDVTQVKVDGVILVEGVNYRVDDYRKVVRIDGVLWPFCQDLSKADTEVGTWSMTVTFGEPVPALGSLAVGELALEIVKYLTCAADCQLPQGVVDISRQGVSMTIGAISEILKNGFIQLRWCDLFIATANPHGLDARPAVIDLDSPDFRVVGT